MTEDEALEGALVPAPKPADIRYEDETPPDAVTRVLVVVERADGSVKEYEAREPRDWQMNDPESIAAQVFRPTGFSLGAGGRFRGLQAGMPSLRLSFTAHPRYNLHIRNRRNEPTQAYCQQPIWDGACKYACGRTIVDGECGRHGPQSSIPSSSTSSPAATGKGS